MEKKIKAVLLSFSGWKLCKLIALIITTATTTENLSCRLIHPTSKLNNSCCLNSVPAANTEASILPKRVIQILRNIWRIFKDLFLDISKFSSHNKDWLFFFFPPKVQVIYDYMTIYSHIYDYIVILKQIWHEMEAIHTWMDFVRNFVWENMALSCCEGLSDLEVLVLLGALSSKECTKQQSRWSESIT